LHTNIPSFQTKGYFLRGDFLYLQDFFDGLSLDSYHYFGAHYDGEGCFFRVYAPYASRVSLISSHSDWEPVTMLRDPAGVYQTYVSGLLPGTLYKYQITHRDGTVVDKCDPYGFQMELRPNNASIVTQTEADVFTDQIWMNNRRVNYDAPMNIYELHLGSWKQREHGEEGVDEYGWYSYVSILEELIPYLKKHHYTHIELMPLSEHPLDASWGYQTSGFFAPTSRYGTPRELKEMVNLCHRNGIGVILDFVPVHFVRDQFALSQFDGTALYEYGHNEIGYSEWGSCNFDYYKGHVRSFLMSAANYWLEEFHFDGLRMDAIANVLYWQGDMSRGVNIGGIHFLKDMNVALKQRHPDVMLIAEDSTNYLKVTAPVQYDGLGFDFKWNMGWMNDTLSFFKIPPQYRSAQYHQLSFSMLYFYNELYLLPFSHDEVVHGKATIMQKMWGDYDVKFPQCRTLFLYMYAHPGKKLNFMGNEIGQFREWDEKQETDWSLLSYPMHDGFRAFCAELNRLYVTMSPLYDGDYDPHRFCWLEIDAPQECVYAFRRTSSDGSAIVAVMNLSDRCYDPFYIGVDEPMAMRPLICSDEARWGGSGCFDEGMIVTEKKAHKGRSYRLPVRLAPFGSALYMIVKK